MWGTKVEIRYLMTEDEGHAEVQANMDAIADVLEASVSFSTFRPALIEKMRNIPKGDEFFAPVDYANKLLDRVYDYADEHRIWIE